MVQNENGQPKTLNSELLRGKVFPGIIHKIWRRNRTRRSPNLGIATFVLDSLGNTLGIDGLGSSITPADALITLVAARKRLILYQNNSEMYLLFPQITSTKEQVLLRAKLSELLGHKVLWFYHAIVTICDVKIF